MTYAHIPLSRLRSAVAFCAAVSRLAWQFPGDALRPFNWRRLQSGQTQADFRRYAFALREARPAPASALTPPTDRGTARSAARTEPRTGWRSEGRP